VLELADEPVGIPDERIVDAVVLDPHPDTAKLEVMLISCVPLDLQ
jgi:hypothetical protein